MKCEICDKPSGKRVTCSDECLSELKSERATKNRKMGIGWGELVLKRSNIPIPNYEELIR